MVADESATALIAAPNYLVYRHGVLLHNEVRFTDAVSRIPANDHDGWTVVLDTCDYPQRVVWGGVGMAGRGGVAA